MYKRQVLDRALYQHAVVVHDDDVVDESFHVLNNMRRKEYGFMFGLAVFPHVVDEEAAVAGVETQREVIEDKQVGVLCQNEPECHLGALAARHGRSFLFRSDFQPVYQRPIGITFPVLVKSRREFLYLVYVHEAVLDMTLSLIHISGGGRSRFPPSHLRTFARLRSL